MGEGEEKKEEKKIAWPAWLALGAGHAVDIASTHQALKNPSLREGNPLLGPKPSLTRLLTTKAIGVLGQVLVMRFLRRRGKRKAAEALGYASGAFTGAIAANNIRQAKKGKEKGK